MQIETIRFGPLEVADDAILHFPRGLYGLEAVRRCCLIAPGEAGPFHWLQAADAPEIAMVVTDPFAFFPDYQVEIPDAAAELLQARASTDVAIYTPLTIAAREKVIYTNLLGPLVINHQARVGVQIIQDAARYQTRHPLPPLKEDAAAANIPNGRATALPAGAG